MFLLECPRCRNRMKYEPLKKSARASSSAAAAATTATASAAAMDISKKKKKCVYCNFSMDVGKSVVQKI